MLCAAFTACAAAPAAAITGGASASPDPTTSAAPDAATSTAPMSGGSGYAPGLPALIVKPATMLGHILNIHGVMPLRAAMRQRVLVERLDRVRGGWRTVAVARVGRSGRFLAQWRTDHIGHFTLRAVLAGHTQRARATSTPLTSVAVYRFARTTFFGPGFFGHLTACGQILTPELQGVAHRWLPCGTLVEIYHAGTIMTVPVIDRGPFAAGTEWDLTQATAASLGFGGLGNLGFMRAPLPS